MQPDLPTLERKLKGVRREVRNLQVMQMRPGQSVQELKVLSDLERSARAEVKLRVKALEYARKQSGQEQPPVKAYLLNPSQHLQQASDLKKVNPQSRGAELHILAARLKSR